ncbi:hypothetical protein HYH02_011974 [Chlamydomonas schloesseri]|uniref:Peptidase M3A/M3B catalytic domain-containing protein n=1 Tax=Chlamydomonas schloesseri TaxID=2026947 RepID=A0A835TBI9_9CHLO|nr:hypothetical protein HYH02_011974 [Chlamydomonas schloesseri]|eukprot:KAG2434975.1 hypothetical protein HYH02_011974 [Chlamydomonas schloesseri]
MWTLGRRSCRRALWGAFGGSGKCAAGPGPATCGTPATGFPAKTYLGPVRRLADWASFLRGDSNSSAFKTDSGRSGGKGAGLFGRPELQQPSDWQRVAAATEARCDELLADILKCTPSDGVRVVQLMDDMSDELCRAYDAAECCRNVHVDPEWRHAAERVCVKLGSYISRVNAHTGMYQRLSEALAAYEAGAKALSNHTAPELRPWQMGGWCRESVLVAQRLKQDMEQAGIHLPAAQRARVAELAAANGHFAAAFNAALTDTRKVGRASIGLGRWVPLDPSSVAGVMAGEPHESVRKTVYTAAGRSPACNRELLDRMVAVRAEMAQLQGYPSYAALRTRGNSLAGTPAAVVGFLTRLAADVRPLAEQELKVLAQLKAFDSRDVTFATSPASTSLAAWDVEYYAARARQALVTSAPGALLRYTALPSVLAGVRTLLRAVFRIELVLGPVAPGEGWAPGVLRAEARHPDLGPLGTVYLDLGDRPGKYPSAVTFPITCGRQLPGSDVEAALAANARRQHGGAGGGAGGPRQLPVMALLASATGRCPVTGVPALTYRELRVLLHELGHCVHNLLSRTKYQHLWGTRCAQDLVEVPSHLFEYWATDPLTMGLLARDRSNTQPDTGAAAGPGGGGEPLPPALLEELIAGRAATAALELQQQLALSLADQWLFGENPPKPTEAAGSPSSWTSSDVWRKAMEVASSVPYVPGTSPELRVGHLTIYGGSYYGYVYARCLAAQLWRASGLADAPLDPGAGELLRERLLGPGGAVEPLELLTGFAEAAAAGEGAGSPVGSAAARQARGRQLRLAMQRQRDQHHHQQSRGVQEAVPGGGLLQSLDGGYAPRSDYYLETLKTGIAA